MQQITFLAGNDLAPFLGDQLLSQGAVSITYLDAGDNPIFEPEINTMPLWETTFVTALFIEEFDLEELLTKLKKKLKLTTVPEYRIEDVPDKDWERVWMDEFKPMQFGPKLWICPSWCEAPDPSAVNILLDPGLAFGSGTHPTTSLCLQWLALHDLAKKQVIDYGCGSGILAIAAAKLGAAKITAVDLHPQALEATFDNATQNGVAEKIVIVSPEEFIEEPCDVLLANILAGPLMQLAPTFSTLVKPGGHLVLSGILHEQVPAILNCYASWFELSEPVFLEEWSLIHGVRR